MSLEQTHPFLLRIRGGAACYASRKLFVLICKSSDDSHSPFACCDKLRLSLMYL